MGFFLHITSENTRSLLDVPCKTHQLSLSKFTTQINNVPILQFNANFACASSLFGDIIVLMKQENFQTPKVLLEVLTLTNQKEIIGCHDFFCSQLQIERNKTM